MNSLNTYLPDELRGALNILVVEDNRINRKVVELTFKKAGLTCDLASDGLEALRFTAEKQYDIIFMDVHMPNMDGMEATRNIRNNHNSLNAEVPVIAFTGSIFEHEKELCKQAGMDDFIPKPVELPKLISVVNEWATKKALVA